VRWQQWKSGRRIWVTVALVLPGFFVDDHADHCYSGDDKYNDNGHFVFLLAN